MFISQLCQYFFRIPKTKMNLGQSLSVTIINALLRGLLEVEYGSIVIDGERHGADGIDSWVPLKL